MNPACGGNQQLQVCCTFPFRLHFLHLGRSVYLRAILFFSLNVPSFPCPEDFLFFAIFYIFNSNRPFAPNLPHRKGVRIDAGTWLSSWGSLETVAPRARSSMRNRCNCCVTRWLRSRRQMTKDLPDSLNAAQLVQQRSPHNMTSRKYSKTSKSWRRGKIGSTGHGSCGVLRAKPTKM